MSRDAAPDEIQRAYRKLARTYHPDVNKDPAPRIASRRSPRPTTCCRIPTRGSATTRSDTDFRQVPDDVDPEHGRGLAPRRPGGRTGPPGPAGGTTWFSSGGGDVGDGVDFGDVGIDFDDLFGGIFGRRGRRAGDRFPAPTRRPSSSLTVEEAYRGGRRTITLQGTDGPRTLRGRHPGRRHRRSAHPPRRAGRSRQRRRAARRPLPRRAHRARPALPPRGPRHLRRAPAEPVGGGARRVGRGRDTGWRGEGARAAGHVERPAAPVARARHAEPRRQARRPLRRGADHGAHDAERRRAPPLRGAVARRRRSTRGGNDEHATTGSTTGAIARTTRLDPPRLDLESFSRATNLHPELVRRFVALGLLDATKDAAGELRFPPPQLAAAARLQRLRAGFALNYAALGLVADLLDRIAALETALRERPRRPRQQEPEVDGGP